VYEELDRLDRATQRAQRDALAAVALNGPVDLRQKGKELIELDKRLDSAQDAAWRSIKFTRTIPVQISGPLSLALLQWHIETHRTFGPIAHTVVPDLANDSGCAGDLIGDRLIAVYGWLLSGNSSSNPPERWDRTLDVIARQIACLSVPQLFDLEFALTTGFVSVAHRMRLAGFGDLTPAFARAAAPIMLLVLDARKHRGERSLAWVWFALYGPILETVVETAGWSTNNALYLWGRRQASLIATPLCIAASSQAACVDIRVFLRSLRDPRAIGLGDCSLAGMVALGATETVAGPRYICPSIPCRAEASRLIGIQEREAILDQLADRWPDLDRSDLLPQSSGTATPICLPSTDTALQGGTLSGGECIDPPLRQSKNPWDRYAVCMTQALDGSPEIFASLPGVPLGRGCGLISDPDGPETTLPEIVVRAKRPSTSTTTSTTTRLPPDNPFSDLQWKQGSNSNDTQKGIDNIYDNTKDGVFKLKRTRPPKTKAELQAKAWDLWTQLAGPLPQDTRDGIYRQLYEIHDALQKAKDCVDPGSCANACTGLGAQVARAKLCTSDLLDAFLEAMGRSSRRPAAGAIHRRLDIVSYYDPDTATISDSTGDICQAGDLGTVQRPSQACGLILCARGGDLATTTGNQCSCGSVLSAFTPRHLECLAKRCADDAILGSDCTCQSLVVPEGGRGGVDPRGAPQ
jgi:hypothetical protein